MNSYPRDILRHLALPGEKTLIRDATIISMDPAVGNLVRGDILVMGRTITAVGERLNVDDAIVIDAKDMIAIPGMVDSHRHAWEGQLRRINSNAETLEHYSNATHFSFAKHYRPQDMYVGTLLSALGAIDAGITTVIDNSHNSRTAAHSDAAVEALLDAGIRALHASGAPVSGSWDRAHWPGNLARLQDKYFKDPRNELVTLATMANIEPELWAEARRLGIPIVTEFFGEQMGAQLQALHAQGLLGPDNIFNHCTCLKDEGWEILRDAGVHINVCPRSDAHYGIEDGMFAWDAAIRHGLRPGFSVDNETSYSGDMFMEMRVAYYLERVLRVNSRPPRAAGTEQDPLNSHRLLEAATLDGAACAGLQDKIGSLTPGKQADIVLFRTGDINLYPSNNAFGTVVHAAERSNIDSVMVGGRMLKRDGVMCGLDLPKLRAAVDESCAHLFSAAGYEPDVFGTSFPVLAQR